MIKLIVVGKPKEGFFNDGITTFQKRLNKYKVRLEFLKGLEVPKHPNQYLNVKIKEWNLVRSRIGKRDIVFLWDQKGDLWDTNTLVRFVKEKVWRGQHVSMVIGGVLGFPDIAYEEAGYVVSLSRFTFTHQMATLMVLEQLYRVYKIVNGERYAY